MITVKRLLQAKGDEIWSTTPETSVFDALILMAEKNIGALMVLESGKLAGIFSERDYARKVILKGKTSKEVRVGEIMTEKVITVAPNHSIDECMKLMTDNHIRHLPVIDDQRLVGVIAIGDVLKAIIAEQQSTINQLEDYIKGKQ
ncbi:MAG: CBS domain-containing protein [Ignavibacteria bacterium]|nr:CBS domain-containing protein [Ignavibacteria bacterium]